MPGLLFQLAQTFSSKSKGKALGLRFLPAAVVLMMHDHLPWIGTVLKHHIDPHLNFQGLV